LHKLNLARENELKERIEAVNREREEKLAVARDEADKIIKEAVLASAKLTSDMEASAEAKVSVAMSRANLDLQRKEQAMLALRQQDILQAAVKLVAAAFSVKGMDVLHGQLVDEAIEELLGLDPSMFVSCGQDISVSCTALLDEARKVRIKGILVEKTGHAVDVTFNEAQDLVAGISIHAGAMTIDGTLRNKLGRVLEHLQKI
jgi:vacuolar-type H+-ATPase subunit H